MPKFGERMAKVWADLKESGREEIRAEAAPLIPLDDLTADEFEAALDCYPRYQIGRSYAVGEVFNYEGTALYKVLQAHTSQSDWPPPTTPSLYLWVAPPGTIAEWVQPTGAHDAYAIGAMVTHNGKTWRSLIDANVWEPGSVGAESLWEEVIA